MTTPCQPRSEAAEQRYGARVARQTRRALAQAGTEDACLSAPLDAQSPELKPDGLNGTFAYVGRLPRHSPLRYSKHDQLLLGVEFADGRSDNN